MAEAKLVGADRVIAVLTELAAHPQSLPPPPAWPDRSKPSS